VPQGARSALLCRYEGSGTSLTLAGRPVLATDVDAVGKTLNGLPSQIPGGATDAGMCMLANTPEYRVVLDYPDGVTAVVEIAPQCATARRDGVVRYLTSVSAVLDLWPE
jgi:hypothetical protein